MQGDEGHRDHAVDVGRELQAAPSTCNGGGETGRGMRQSGAMLLAPEGQPMDAACNSGAAAGCSWILGLRTGPVIWLFEKSITFRLTNESLVMANSAGKGPLSRLLEICRHGTSGEGADEHRGRSS